MRNSLLISSLLFAGMAFSASSASAADDSTRAEGSLEFKYFEAPTMAMRLGPALAPDGSRIYLCVKMREEDAKEYAGNKVKAIKFWNGYDVSGGSDFCVTDFEVFITESLEKQPVVRQACKGSGKALEPNTITLDTPYTIKGDGPIYFGTNMEVPAQQTFYIPVEFTNRTEEDNFINGTSTDGGFPVSWRHQGNVLGAYCCALIIEGSELPVNLVTISGAAFPQSVETGHEGSYTLTLTNGGGNDVKNVEVRTTVGSAEPVTFTYDVAEPIALSETGTVTIDRIPFNEAGFHTVKAELLKVNGEDNETGDIPTVLGRVAVFSGGFQRNLVIEEGTGTWCGWCPSGIVMLDYIKEHYNDRFFTVAGHYNDRMQCDDYLSFLTSNFTGFPKTLTNRVDLFTPTSTDPSCTDMADMLYAKYAPYASYCRVSAVCELSDNTVKVNAETEFVIDSDVPHTVYAILTENGVGPFDQENYYSGGGVGLMAGWEEKGSTVSTVYEDVVRAYSGNGGINGSVPSAIKAGEKYSCTVDLSMAKCTGTDLKDRNVVVFIVNKQSGEVMNACRVNLDNPNSVEAIDVEDGEAAYYNLQGIRVANPEKGLYIKVQNGKSTKVVF